MRGIWHRGESVRRLLRDRETRTPGARSRTGRRIGTRSGLGLPTLPSAEQPLATTRKRNAAAASILPPMQGIQCFLFFTPSSELNVETMQKERKTTWESTFLFSPSVFSPRSERRFQVVAKHPAKGGKTHGELKALLRPRSSDGDSHAPRVTRMETSA